MSKEGSVEDEEGSVLPVPTTTASSKKRVRKSEVRVRDEDADYDPDHGDDEDGGGEEEKRKPKLKKRGEERGIMAGSDAALRRRDRIKSTTRYSPPLPTTSATRDRRKSSLSSNYSRSTASSLRTGGKEVKSCPVDVQREAEGGKMLITLPDGTTYRLDGIPVPAGSAGKSKRRHNASAADDEDTDEDAIIETGLDDPDDDDYEPTYNQLKKIKPVVAAATAAAADTTKKTPQRRSAAGSNSIMREIARPPRSSLPQKNPADEMRTTAIITGSTKVTYVAGPKAVTVTAAVPAAVRQPPKRNYGVQSKFIDDLVELSDCTDPGVLSSDEAKKYGRTPDTMLLINSDLPLQYCTSISLISPAAKNSSTTSNAASLSSSSHSLSSSASASSSALQAVGTTGASQSSSDRVYAFRQILSPHSNSYPCLLCPQRSASASKSENELKAHYSMVHELTVEVAASKVADDVIYVCLSKSSLSAIQTGQDVDLTAALPDTRCQYCESLTLPTLSSLKQHYESEHGNRIELIDQEMILKMHEHLYCYSCDQLSFTDFKSLNRHMMEEHGMHTYPCRSCPFFTRDEVRLKSHFRAKHMMNSGSNHMTQCTECPYCRGIMYGNERMSRHIMTAHCIQTAVGEYSCQKCLQLAGSPDTLISHSSTCPALRNPGTAGNNTDSGQADREEGSGEGSATSSTQFGCFLCEKIFSSAAVCQLHLDHQHTRWVPRDKPLDRLIRVEELPSVKRLEEAEIRAPNGFYCPSCDKDKRPNLTFNKIYPLYYLHMANYHSMEKVFQCKVSSCGQRFTGSENLLIHMNETSHPQASVMEDTLGAICCHFCDMYFKDRREFEMHHLTDQHAEKMSSITDTKSFVAGRQEAINWKCIECHTRFGLTDSFVYHMEHEIHDYPCPYCGMDNKLPSSRRTHIQSHHPEKTDCCEVCHEKQGSKERVVAHLVTHNIVFECNTCMKKFYQREQLNSHTETHGPAVECRWTGCNKKVNPASLNSHIKQHRIEKNSKCLQCNKVFASKSLLDVHKEVHAQAEISARAIISQSAASAAAKTAATVSPAVSTPDTTVISITTAGNAVSPAKTTPVSNTGSRSRTKSSASGGTSLTSNNTQSKSEIPEGLRVMCCTCNQLFNSQTELFSHKCSLGTGINGKGRRCGDLQSGSSLDPITLDPDDAGGSGSSSRSPRCKTYSGRGKQVHQQQQQQQSKPPLPAVQEVIQSEGSINQQSLVNPQHQHVPPLQSDPSLQTYLLEQPDGQVMEIQCPIGMDINDVLASLQLQAQQPLPDETVTGVNDATCNDMMSLDASVGSSTVLGMESGAIGGEVGLDGQQLIYIPVNEDGSYAIDPASLAMLTAAAGAGEVAS